MLRVLTLSTLFPDATRPNFGVFVERQTLGLAAHPDVDLRAVAPIGLPPWPLSKLQHSALATLPPKETWKGLEVYRPCFLAMPGIGGRLHATAVTRSLIPLLTEIRRSFPFDVIDAEFFFPDGPAAVALGQRFRVPVSIKARGADIHYWGHATGTARQVRRAGQAASGLLAVSEAMRADMASIGIPANKVRVHHTGVDLTRFTPATRTTDSRHVVSLGALIPRKGHDIVLRAVASLAGVSLDIIGEGPERGRLEADISRLGVGDRIRLLGTVPHADLPALLAAANVMALASASEGLANAWVEALACGTPIVITDAGGAGEVVTDAAYGRIVARDDAAFASAIAALLADPPAPDSVRDGAAGFTWEVNTAALYAHLLALAA